MNGVQSLLWHFQSMIWTPISASKSVTRFAQTIFPMYNIICNEAPPGTIGGRFFYGEG
jgi:hypothetical protein